MDFGLILSACTVYVDSLLKTNLGTLFVKRRTGFLSYADDPKVRASFQVHNYNKSSFQIVQD